MAPKTECNTSTSEHRDHWPWLVSEFVEHLKQTGAREWQVKEFRSSARHFLDFLERDGTGVEAINDAVLRRYRHHDCQCADTKRSRRYKREAKRSWRFMTGVVRFVQFLEENRHTPHLGELDRGFQLMDEFLERRVTDGYTSLTLDVCRSGCRHFLIWLHGSRISMKQIDAEIIERYWKHECFCPGYLQGQTRCAESFIIGRNALIKRFIEYLAEREAISDTWLSSVGELHEDFEEYRTWLKQHRGIADRAIRDYVNKAAALAEDLKTEPDRYDAALIRQVLLRRFANVSRTHAKSLATAMRMYLRFLVSKGDCPPRLIAAVPTAPGWRLATLPRYLPVADIERAIALCDVTTRVGMRDRAILLLLARLALRASDVAMLRLSDIDWHSARLRVCGKSKRTVRFPLPQDVGDALLSYIEHARPRMEEERVFLRVLAPYGPFHSSRPISQIASRALQRAGVDNANVRGAHVFRHSAATSLLRSGASLNSIGALLRHRSPNTTAIYAKVDIPMLQQVTQAWIGDVG